KTQAKGSFKVMADDVAQKLESDIILPKSSVKPEYRGSLVRSVRSLLGDRQAHVYRSPIVLGIRDVSRDLQIKSSYTLLAADYDELRAQDSLKELFDSTVNAYQNVLNLTRAQHRAGLSSDEAV